MQEPLQKSIVGRCDNCRHDGLLYVIVLVRDGERKRYQVCLVCKKFIQKRLNG